MKTFIYSWIVLGLLVASTAEVTAQNLASRYGAKRIQSNSKSYLQSPQMLTGPEISLIRNDSLEGWATTSGKTLSSAWTIENGVLHLKGKGGDIMTEREYENYILDFAWTISKGGNSGIKYRFKKFEGKGWLGCEYQVLDDFNIPEGKKPKNNTATLYDILPTNGQKHLKPHTEMNYGRIVVNGDRIQHWLNGQKVIDVVVGSEEWKQGIAESKFKDVEGFGENIIGRIMVQDHNSEVWFHKLTIREIYPETPSCLAQDVPSCSTTSSDSVTCRAKCVKKSCRTTTYCRPVCKPTYCKPAYCKPVYCKPATCKPVYCKPACCKSQYSQPFCR